MPIEIRQLIIRAVVERRSDDARPRAASSNPPPPLVARSAPAPIPRAEDRDALVASVVREVLRELRKSRER